MVERLLPKQDIVGSSPITRSFLRKPILSIGFFVRQVSMITRFLFELGYGQYKWFAIISAELLLYQFEPRENGSGDGLVKMQGAEGAIHGFSR